MSHPAVPQFPSEFQIIQRAFILANLSHDSCRPVFILEALREVGGHIGDIIGQAGLSPPTLSDTRPSGRYLVAQVQDTAGALARRRSETVTPSHILIALLEQRDVEVIEALVRAHIDTEAARDAAFALLGMGKQTPFLMSPLVPAGTLDRPPLAVEQLHDQAWSALLARQKRLPIQVLRRPSDVAALSHIERNAAERLSTRLKLDDDERASLGVHHLHAVQQRVAEVRPDLARAGLAFESTGTSMASSRVTQPLQRPHRTSRRIIPVGLHPWCINRVATARSSYMYVRLRLSHHHGQ